MPKLYIKITAVLLSMLFLVLPLAACQQVGFPENDKLNVVTTTTMITDLVKEIGGDRINLIGLMGTGIDPHLFQASAGDIRVLLDADVFVFGGLHLEGRMAKIMERLSESGKNVLNIGAGIDLPKLLTQGEDSTLPDPHIWFDVGLWMDAAALVSEKLQAADGENAAYYKEKGEKYISELQELDTYIKDRVATLPESSRVLVTAHDAFAYFGHAYGFTVRGLQGINTSAEAGTADVSDLASYIAQNRIKAIFTESSVPVKQIEALRDAVRAKGFEVTIGEELYSDSLGDAASGTETYIKTFRYNIDAIVDALKG